MATCKRFLALLAAVLLLMATPMAMAADSPFKDGVNYYDHYNEFGCVPSLLNFGSVKCAPNQSLQDVKNKGQTIKKGSARSIENSIDDLTYYVYAKWQYAQAISYHYIEAMLVITDPKGNYYATYGDWGISDMRRKTICSWMFDVTDCLKNCMEDNGGSLPRGQYVFTMYFNDQIFRTNTVPIT